MAIQTYYDRYDEIKKQYKIAMGEFQLVPFNVRQTMSSSEIEEAKKKAIDEYDIVIECIGTGYAHKKYRVVKNGPELSTQELAIICDHGNLCFGYRTEGDIICVYTD